MEPPTENEMFLDVMDNLEAALYDLREIRFRAENEERPAMARSAALMVSKLESLSAEVFVYGVMATTSDEYPNLTPPKR